MQSLTWKKEYKKQLSRYDGLLDEPHSSAKDLSSAGSELVEAAEVLMNGGVKGNQARLAAGLLG
jgi:hypothetical protein